MSKKQFNCRCPQGDGPTRYLCNPLETLYDYERWSIRILIVVLMIFGIGIAGHTLDVENPLSEAVYTYFLDSIFE